MTYGAIPDVEALIVETLLASEAVTEIVGETGVSTDLPPEAELPRVRVALSGGSLTVRGWLHAVKINLEAWSQTKEEAFDLINACAVTLTELEDGAQVEQGVVTGVSQETGLAWSPDPVTKTPRYILGFVINIHPEIQE